jgi:carboxyl-terminal processing protease
MEPTRPTLLPTLIAALLVIAAFVVGYQVDKPNRMVSSLRPVWAALADGDTRPDVVLDNTASLKPVQLFQEALSDVQSEYIDAITDEQRQQFAYAAIRGMLATLNDPYTRFMDPKEYKDFNSDNAGHFAGIGATLNMLEIPTVTPPAGEGTAEDLICPVCGADLSQPRHFRVAVIDTLPGSPAKAAGLQPNDYILKVDDTSTDGMLVSEVADLIHGPKDTPVTLTIARKGLTKPLDVKLVRAEIDVPSVEYKVLDGGIGYLRIFQFNDKTTTETREALAALKKAAVTGILLDLRNNPGGLLDECVNVASMMLPPDDKLIVSSKGRNGAPDDRMRVGGNDYSAQPMVVLVNRGSASASEILSGALKDYRRAKIIGDRTYGKGLVQTVLRLGDRATPCAMAVTTAHYYTPNNFDVHKKGITPDVEVKLDAGVRTLSESDNQAVAAIRLLKDQIARTP